MSHSASIGLSPSEWKWITQNVINACHEQQAERNTLLSVSEGERYWFLNDSSPPSTSLGSFLKASCSLERSYHPPRVPLCKVSRSGLAWNLNLILCEITRKAISPPSWVSFRNGICSTTNISRPYWRALKYSSQLSGLPPCPTPFYLSVSVGFEYETCPSLILWEKRTAVLQGFELDPSNLGGWSLDKHHILNVKSGMWARSFSKYSPVSPPAPPLQLWYLCGSPSPSLSHFSSNTQSTHRFSHLLLLNVKECWAGFPRPSTSLHVTILLLLSLQTWSYPVP